MPFPPYDARSRDAKTRLFVACFVLIIIYIGFSFAFHAFADPPTSPYIPGETLSPTCAPGSSNCTVEPPLFSTSTLPLGGVPFVSDTSGTISANTSSLYFNSAASIFSVSPGRFSGGFTLGTTTLPSGYYGNIVANSTSGLQWNLQNFSSSSYSEFVLTADTGSTSTNYGGIGINNSNNSSTAENPYDTFVEGTNGIDIEPCVTGSTSSQCDLQVSIGGNQSNNTVFEINSSTAVFDVPVVDTSSLTVAGTSLFTGTMVDVTNINAGSLSFPNAGNEPSNSASLYFGAPTANFTSPDGTYIGINSPTADNYDLMAFQVNSSTIFRVASSGALTIGTSSYVSGNLLTVAGKSALGVASATEGRLVFYNSLNTSTITLQASTAGSKAITLTLPSSTGVAGQSLVTDGSGNLSWGSTGFTKNVSSSAVQALTTSMASYVSVGLTPSNVASQIWITADVAVSSTAATSSAQVAIFRGSSACTTQVGNTVAVTYTRSAASQGGQASVALNVIDAPGVNTTENYTLCAKAPVANGSIVSGQLTLQEIRAGSDVAEDYNAATDTPLVAGDVVSPDPSIDAGVMQSQSPYDGTALGVVSTQPGAVLGNSNPDSGGQVLVALAGRVPVNVTNDNGNINVGDYLTSSDIPGVAMRSTQPGKTIGIALESFTPDPSEGSVTGTILMFVNPGWSLGNLTDPAAIASSSWALVNASSGTQFALDQFTAYVQAALAKLGVNIENGIVTLQKLIANQVETNVLCVQGVCVDGNQLQTLLTQDSSTPVSNAPPDSPDSTDSTSTDPTAVSSSTLPAVDTSSTIVSDPTSTVPVDSDGSVASSTN